MEMSVIRSRSSEVAEARGLFRGHRDRHRVLREVVDDVIDAANTTFGIVVLPYPTL